MNILGINTSHADASAALLVDGQLVFAIDEERLNRKKHYAGFPQLAVQACLDAANLKLRDIDHVALGRDSSANVRQKIQYALLNPAMFKNLMAIRKRGVSLDDLRGLLSAGLEVDPAEMRFTEHHVEHHLAHIASAFYCSDFDECAGLSYDGSGDFVSTMFAHCRGNSIEILSRVYLPSSLGTFYATICRYIGYHHYGDEGKVMGLAPYGEDTYQDFYAEALQLLDEGQFRLHKDYFPRIGHDQGMKIDDEGFVHQSTSFTPKMVERFGPPREPYTDLSQRDKDLALGMQKRFEEGFMHLVNHVARATRSDRLALAGGCALNSVANGKLFGRTPIRQTYIQPAAGDEGLALGAALYVYHQALGHPRSFRMEHSYWGHSFTDEAIEAELKRAGLKYERLEREQLLARTAERINAHDVTGWFQGRMEWGPRALGNRSILTHPGVPNMKDILNSRIKRREWFRPFAPSVLAERQSEIFDHDHPSPFMLHVYRIKPEWRERLCTVNHVDNTGRLQTVARHENELYYDLISAFERLSGIPIVLNTSFNENEPIVCTPREAIDCFIRSYMDTLAIGNCFVRRPDNEQLDQHPATV